MSLGRLWRGDLPLDDAFWTYAVIGGIAVNLLTSTAFLVLVSMDRPVAALIAGYAPSLPYNLVATVGVFRAAARDNADPRKAQLYPFITAAVMVLLSVT